MEKIILIFAAVLAVSVAEPVPEANPEADPTFFHRVVYYPTYRHYWKRSADAEPAANPAASPEADPTFLSTVYVPTYYYPSYGYGHYWKRSADAGWFDDIADKISEKIRPAANQLGKKLSQFSRKLGQL